MSLQALAALSGMSTSHLHHYLVSLVRVGLVRRDLGHYVLGSFTPELCLVAADNLGLQHASAGWFRQLSAATEARSFFAVSSTQGALVVRWEQGSRPLTVHARLGTVMPILTSSAGLVWLSSDPEGSASMFDSELWRIDPALRQGVREARLLDSAHVRKRGHGCFSRLHDGQCQRVVVSGDQSEFKICWNTDRFWTSR